MTDVKAIEASFKGAFQEKYLRESKFSRELMNFGLAINSDA
jgi:hypothetical protein